jgi:hypothetical protein
VYLTARHQSNHSQVTVCMDGIAIGCSRHRALCCPHERDQQHQSSAHPTQAAGIYNRNNHPSSTAQRRDIIARSMTAVCCKANCKTAKACADACASLGCFEHTPPVPCTGVLLLSFCVAKAYIDLACQAAASSPHATSACPLLTPSTVTSHVRPPLCTPKPVHTSTYGPNARCADHTRTAPRRAPRAQRQRRRAAGAISPPPWRARARAGCRWCPCGAS